MTTTRYQLIDTDTHTILAEADTAAEALAGLPYEPTDIVDDAADWSDVVAAAAAHRDGYPGLIHGYTIARVTHA